MRGWRVVLVVACLAAPGLVRAESEPGLRAQIHVAPGHPCIDAAALGEQIAAWLGTRTIDPRIAIHAAEGPPGSGEASFRVQRGGEVLAERVFSPAPPGCVQRGATMALAIALVLEASLLEELALAPPSRRAPVAPAPVRLGLSALLTRSVGVLPRAGWGGALALSWAREGGLGTRVWLGGSAAPAAAIPDSGGRVVAQLYALGLDGCAHSTRLGRLSGAACLGLTGGLLALRGHGFEPGYRRRLAWGAGNVSALLSARMSPQLAIEARVAMQVLFTPVEVEARAADGSLQGQRELPAVGGELALGPAFTF